ncbi:hypothetical protein Hanom_Chr09g00760031 [Helianthus anomalus]
MELTSRMKMTSFQTFWIQVQNNKPLDESRKTCQTSGIKMAFYSFCFNQPTLTMFLRQLANRCSTI